ncbi:hypothetical protein DBIPINDM_002908 [Mesorhizobium sp. AR02]|uniref:hypothetical protein n=1 Tax=Mesorhizobium sp. AR02 TaxID=2865837 RepID=UPI00215F10BC|nr:hypothetical protein [Mesorhizobium sp. AR02]UVK56313.1 hypothetical protein DBIPINDM_002908 [Mesorhizobium sp. AR02]
MTTEQHTGMSGAMMASSADEFRDRIVAIMADRQAAASASPYDWKVCVGAVSAAQAEFEKVVVAGTAHDYAAAVISRLERLRDAYYDPDGEYTSGRSDIGTVIEQIRKALKSIGE